MTNEQIETAIKQMAQLLADTARELAPCIERLQGSDDHPGPMGGVIHLPTAAQRATGLRAGADALLKAPGLESTIHRDLSQEKAE